jgi:hypothetical protein
MFSGDRVVAIPIGAQRQPAEARLVLDRAVGELALDHVRRQPLGAARWAFSLMHGSASAATAGASASAVPAVAVATGAPSTVSAMARRDE